MALTTIATYRITAPHPFRVVIAKGSIVDFTYPPNPSHSAIVNAANEGCISGGGVDGAVGDAGGPTLLADRRSLPQDRAGLGVRCPTGRAVVTGPNSYGALKVPFVIHAVGPNFLDYPADEGDELLSSAYTSSLQCGKNAHLEAIAFCLLSAGIYRGSKTLKEVLRIGLETVSTFEGYEVLKEIYICGFKMQELKALVEIAKEIGLKKVDSVDERHEGSSLKAISNGNTQSPQNSQQERRSLHSQQAGEGQEHQQEEGTDNEGEKREEWEIRRDEMKKDGDSHFRSKSFAMAIQAYENALQLDPTNHIILSNKSAAHLANGEKSKALQDAKKCVDHAGTWAKGYTRLGAAMASLGRFNEAASVYSKVLNELDPDNAVARKGLQDCRAKQQQLRDEKEREARKLQMELDRQKEEKEKQKKDKDVCKNASHEDDDLLDDFFSEVEKASGHHKSSQKEGTNGSGDDAGSNRIKTQLSDLGTSTSQIERLLQVNYEWKNLNPFYVLDIPHTVDDESVISARYRALSLLVHPDKCPDDPVRAKNAFEQVRKAMSQMNDSDKRRHVRGLILQGIKQGRRDLEAEKSKGSVGKTDSKTEEEELAKMQLKATMKIFAEIEQKRRNIERRKREYEQRERAQEDEEKTKETNEREHDKRWREGERVEKRIGNWRDFQSCSNRAGKKGKFS